MVLQTIMGQPMKRWPEIGFRVTISDVKFMRFLATEIFPGGGVPCDDDIVKYSANAGFAMEETQYLNEHYVRTLDTWTEQLKAARDQAIEVTSEEDYDRYIRYLTGCSDFFNRKISSVAQFTLVK